MKLRNQYILELARLNEEEVGDSLSPEDAAEMAGRLLELYRKLALPAPDMPPTTPPVPPEAQSDPSPP